jgi:hypothetical protein
VKGILSGNFKYEISKKPFGFTRGKQIKNEEKGTGFLSRSGMTCTARGSGFQPEME